MQAPVDLLEAYIAASFTHDLNTCLDREQKGVLRLCCKRLKNAVDSTIDHASVSNDDDLYDLLQRNWPLKSLAINGQLYPRRSIEELKSLLDAACQKFQRLEKLEIEEWDTGAGLPESIVQFNKATLKTLSVPIPIVGLPLSLTQLNKLEQLHLIDTSYCGIEMILRAIAPIQHLKSLKALELDFFKRGGTSFDGGIKLDALYFLELPNFLFSLTSLQKMVLKANFDFAIPEAIGNLKQLETLHITAMRMGNFPETFGQLSSLKHLRVRCTYGFTGLPDSLGKLSALEELRLGDCASLRTLPESLGNLKCLEELQLIRCPRFYRMPDSIGQLTSLRKLAICKAHRLIQLPDSIGNLDLERFVLQACPRLRRSPAVELLLAKEA